MIVEVPAVEFEALSSRAPGESSGEIKVRVDAARGRQQVRFQGEKISRKMIRSIPICKRCP